ncbi:protein abhd8, partial [Quercus suber]
AFHRRIFYLQIEKKKAECVVVGVREVGRVSFSDNSIMSSCLRPLIQSKTSPVVLLHGFDSSCLEWRYPYPLLEEAGLETWAVDILGWGFSDLERLPPCNVKSKREHFYQLWKSHIKRPMILVGPSLGAAVAIDFVANHPKAVEKLVLIDASVYAEGTGNLATLPKIAAYAGVGRLHCLYPWWEDATVDFMISGGYNVSAQIQQVKQKTCIIWGEDDQIIKLHCELQMQLYVKYQIVVIFLMLRGQTQLPNLLWILFMKIAIKRLNVFPNIEVHFPLVQGNFVNVKDYHNLHSILLKMTSHLFINLLGKKLIRN